VSSSTISGVSEERPAAATASLALDLKDLARRGRGTSGWGREDEHRWARRFAEAYAAAGAPLAGPPGLLRALWPMMDAPRRRVRAAVDACPVAPQTAPDREALSGALETALFGPLFEAASRTLVLQLGVAGERGLLAGNDARERFDFFCESLADPRFAAQLLAQYPALTRRLMALTAQWEAQACETAARLGADIGLVRSRIFGGEDPGTWTGVRALGDAHGGGRRVQRLDFASGRSLIYKPRSASMEEGFHALISWANGLGLAPDLAAASAVDRGPYGWTRFIEAAPCPDAAAVARFFRRQGGNLAFAYLLGAVDLHFENVIAAGEHPVIVDLETLFHAPPAPRGPARAGRMAASLLNESVIQTLLLPVYVEGDPDAGGVRRGTDPSALGYVGDQEGVYVAEGWEHADTADMRLAKIRAAMPAAACRPELDGRRVPAAEHVDEILGGFCDAYDFLETHCDALAAHIARFEGATARRVLRPTATYACLVAQSWHPRLGDDAAALETELDRRLRELPGEDRPTGPERADEVRDLMRGDIPYFTFRVGGRGWDACQRRLVAPGGADKARQRWIAEMSFVDFAAPIEKHAMPRRRGDAATDAVVEAQARALGDRLCELAVASAGRASWLFPSLSGGVRLTPTVMGFDLYDGLAGVGLFLGGLGARTGELRYRRMAEAALTEAWTIWCGMEREAVSIGGYDGAGGLAWVLAVLGKLLGRRDWFGWARQIVRTHATEAATDPMLDMISGRAGFLAAGLASAQTAGERATITRLRACAASLTALKREQLPADIDAGFAHGGAGIGFALARLAQVDGDAPALKRALALIESDIATSASVRSGAIEPAHDHDGRAMIAWCRGGVGASLALLRLGLLRTPETQALVAAAADAEGAALCPCHGALGLLEFLDAARGLRVDGASVAYASLRAETLDRMFAGEACADHYHRIETPGMMKGLAGTGWALLRMLDPARFPSALTLEPL
jgi:type 2 lantibiotic biosynthesis protein LanM